MNITSKPKKSLKETYESVKKTLSLFLKKLGLKDNTAIKIEKNIEKKIKQEILVA